MMYLIIRGDFGAQEEEEEKEGVGALSALISLSQCSSLILWVLVNQVSLCGEDQWEESISVG
jgi:hypothetical protein